MHPLLQIREYTSVDRLQDHLHPQCRRRPQYRPRDSLQRLVAHMGICLLDLGNLVDMFDADGTDEPVSLLSRPLFDPSRLFDEIRCRWGPRNEGKRFVWRYLYSCWYRQSRFDMSRAGVEFFAKIHRFDSLSTQCGSYWR
jgi:hypothetical protein